MSDEKNDEKEHQFPKQHQETQPGNEYSMQPTPISINENYRGSGKLEQKVALISGGDSGIGRAVALHFAREGADVAFIYHGEHKDADHTVELIEQEGREALALTGELADKSFCDKAVEKVFEKFGALDILVNNAAEQHVQANIENITPEQLQKTFTTNFFGYFYLTQAALPYLEKRPGAVILNTGSVTSFKGNPKLIDYSSTKGAIQAFTLALAKALAEKKIRVNEIAPGPIWTPLIPASFSAEDVSQFGRNTLMGRAGQPAEVAPAYVFLASEDSSYITGQIIHINGGGYMGI